jgi:hypothetical protein
MVEFNSEQKYTILNKLHGYTGSTQEDEMSAFINSSPGASATMRKMTVAANKMAKANQGVMISSNNVDPELQKEFEEFQKFKRMQKQVVGYQEGGSTASALSIASDVVIDDFNNNTKKEKKETEEEKKAREEQEALAKAAAEKAKAAISDPASLVKKAEVEKIDPTTGVIDTTAGQITGTPDKVIAEKGEVTTVDTPEDITTSTATTAKTTEDVKKATEGFEGAKGEVSEEAKVAAATKDPTSTEVGTVDAAGKGCEVY